MSGEWSEISDLLINVVSSIIALEYIQHGFTNKYAGAKQLLLFICGCMVYFGVGMFFWYERIESDGIIRVSYGLVLLLYGAIALEGSLREKAVMSVMWILIAFISAYLIFGIIGLTTGKGMEILQLNSGNSRLYASMAAAVIKFSLGRGVVALKEKKNRAPGQIEDWAIAGAFFLVFFLIIGMFRLEEGGLGQRGRDMLSLGFLGGVCGIILLLEYFYRKLAKHDQERIKAEFRLKAQESQEEHLKNLWRMSRELRRVRHDLKGSMDVLCHLVKTGKSEEALKYIKQMDETISHYPDLPQETGNEGLNAALLKAVQESGEKGIKFRYTIKKKMSGMDDMNMGILFYNLFSNVMEACDKAVDGREIELEISERAGWLYCRLKNSIRESVLLGNPQFKTEKEDKESHGFGMGTIRSIIKEYKGEYICLEEDGMFIQEILLKQ